MANKGAITGKEVLDGVYEEIAKSDAAMKEFLATYGQFIKQAQSFKTASQGNKISKSSTAEEERFNIAMKERLGLLKKVVVQEEKNKVATRKAAQQLADLRYETQKINREAKQSAILKYGDAYAKLGVQVAKAKRELKNLIVTEGELSNKTKKARIEFDKLNAKIRQADNVAGDFQRNVGNYKSALGGIKSTIRGLIGAFGVIEGIRLGGRLIKDSIALAREAKGVEFAYQRLGEVGVKAFTDIKTSTRGLLSDLDIKKSIVEFDNFNLNLEEAGTLFEFVSLRASQTGKSVDFLRDSLVEGLSKESLLRLDNLGVSANDLRREMDEFGLSVTQAFAKLAKAEIAEAGNQLDEASNGATRFAAGMDNVQLAFGQIFESIKGLGAINDAVSYWATTLKLTNEVLIKQGDLLGTLKVRYNDLTTAGRLQNTQLLSEIENRRENAKAITEEAKAFIKRNESQGPLPQGQQDQEKFGVFATDYEEPIRDVELLNKLIAAQEEKKQGLTKADGKRRDVINANIEVLKKERDAILGVTKAVADLTDKTPQIEKLTNVFEEEFKKSENIFKAFKKTFPDFDEILTIDDAKYESLLTNIVTASKEAGADLEDIFSNVFDTFEGFYGLDLTSFKNLLSDKEVSLDEYAATAKSITSAIFDSQMIKYENEIVANQERLDILLNDENASDAKKKQAQLEADKAEKKIRLKQAKAERKAKIIQINIDTAVGIVKATSLGFPAMIPIIALVAALGIAQAAFVASQPLPTYFKGTQNAPGGFAFTDERGPELHTDKRGNIKDFGTDKGARIKMLEKGDKIFTKMETERMLRLPENNMMQSVSGKLNKDTAQRTNWMGASNAIDTKGIEETMDKVMRKYANRPHFINNSITIKQDTKGYRV